MSSLGSPATLAQQGRGFCLVPDGRSAAQTPAPTRCAAPVTHAVAPPAAVFSETVHLSIPGGADGDSALTGNDITPIGHDPPSQTVLPRARSGAPARRRAPFRPFHIVLDTVPPENIARHRGAHRSSLCGIPEWPGTLECSGV
eukprot:gene12972-biopygen2659